MPYNLMLNEICKVSAINATTALSKFLHTPLGVNIRPVDISEFNDSIINEYNDNTVFMFLPITGNISGGSFFVYSKESALSLCDVLFHRKTGSTKEILEPEQSALEEVTNIVIGHFLTLFAQSLRLESLMHRSPHFENKSFRKTFAQKLASLNPTKELVNIVFSFHDLNIKGSVFILLEKNKILDRLKQVAPISNM